MSHSFLLLVKAVLLREKHTDIITDGLLLFIMTVENNNESCKQEQAIYLLYKLLCACQFEKQGRALAEMQACSPVQLQRCIQSRSSKISKPKSLDSPSTWTFRFFLLNKMLKEKQHKSSLLCHVIVLARYCILCMSPSILLHFRRLVCLCKGWVRIAAPLSATFQVTVAPFWSAEEMYISLRSRT